MDSNPSARNPVDFAEIQRQLQSNQHVTLQLLWEENRQGQPNGYRYRGEVFRKLAEQKESRIEEVHLMPNHVHMSWLSVKWRTGVLR